MQIVSAKDISRAFAGGLQGVADDLTRSVDKVITPYYDTNNVCQRDALNFLASDLDFKIADDEISLLFSSLVEAIKDLLNKLGPPISTAVDVYDVVSALGSSDSFEEFIEKIKDKALSKAGEALDVEKETDDLKRIWDEYEKLKKEDLVERFFEEPEPCNQQLNGLWDKRTGKYLITLHGNCNCQYSGNPKLQDFTIWIAGTISYQKTNAGTYHPTGGLGEIIKLDVTCKPCEKKTSYLIRNEDDLYAYFADNQESFKKSIDHLPTPLLDILKRQEIVQFAVYRKIPQAPPREESVLIALKDGTIDQIWKKYKPAEDPRKITLSVMMDDSTMRGIFNAPNKLEAIGAGLEQDKISLAGQTALNKVYLTMILLGKEISTSFRSGETYGVLTPTKVYL